MPSERFLKSSGETTDEQETTSQKKTKHRPIRKVPDLAYQLYTAGRKLVKTQASPPHERAQSVGSLIAAVTRTLKAGSDLPILQAMSALSEDGLSEAMIILPAIADRACED